MKELWQEKYRPETLAMMVGQQTIVEEMKGIVSGDAPMQHFLFYSREPGTGKTSLAYAMAEEIGWQLHKFNASSKKQRGIDFIEEDIAPMSRFGQWETLFFLDEADRITPQAQDALKGVIEDACGYFILTCNDLTKVSPWLQSRCQVRVFEPIADDLIMEHLAGIAAKEGVEVSDSDLQAIVGKHKGDMRNCIGALQAVSYLHDNARTSFIEGLRVPEIDCKRFLKNCFSSHNKDDDWSIKNIVEELGNTVRDTIHEVFIYAVNSPAKADAKLLVTHAAITSRRDLLLGVPQEYVAWNFVRMLMEKDLEQ